MFHTLTDEAARHTCAASERRRRLGGMVTREYRQYGPDGMPRKQTFTLEFQRYGEDYQNV